MARPIITGPSSISKYILSLVLLCAAPGAAAHGFGQRFDLPLPLELWLAGAGATLVVTFAVMALFVREVRLPRIRLFSLGNATLAVLRILAVLVFVLSIAAGFLGSQDPYRNLMPTMVWVVWWVGLAFVCALVVDLWALANPLATLFPGNSGLVSYPVWLGAWPAVALFLGFARAEVIWPDNDVPSYLACAALAYAVLTWAGMLAFGREAWLAHGEAFALAFGVLGRFAPLEVAGGEERLRVPGAGLDAGVRAAHARHRQLRRLPGNTALPKDRHASPELAPAVRALRGRTTRGRGHRDPRSSCLSTRVYLCVLAHGVGDGGAYRRGRRRAAGVRVRAEPGADRGGLSHFALLLARRHRRPVHHPARLRPVRLRLGPLRHRGLQGRPRHPEPVRVLVFGRHIDRRRARHRGVRRAPRG